MSNAVSALQGAEAHGFAIVKEAGLVGMVTLKTDLGAAATKKAVKSAIGLDMPEARRMTGEGLGKGVAWMAPDEVLILCDHAEAYHVVAELSKALAKSHHLAVNVSDARAVFTIEAPDVREVLGKLTPADLGSLQPGEMRRSRLAQVAGAFWLKDNGHATVICFRSVAQYVFDLLKTASKEGGEPGYY
ncbi:sarcosine oxidase subunit gamma [Rhodobacterales bacterium HKCCE4037]|nr:sarcosine oxidase subunit gamma [Rhodobacterales bacterium HKCCE4037]